MTATPIMESTDATRSAAPDRSTVELVGDWRESGQVSFRQRVGRLCSLLYYHRSSQLAHRAWKLLRERYRRLRPYGDDAYLPESVPGVRVDAGLKSLVSRKLAQRTTPEDAEVVRRFRESRFRFLNREVALSQPVDWRLADHPELPHLWRFQFHYHEYLLAVASTALRDSEQDLIDQIWRFVADWIDGNRLSDSRTGQDAWHPFCVARRLPVWVALWISCPPPDAVADAILMSMGQQAQYLDRHLEWDLGGNHLLEDLRALAVVGGFLEGPVSDRLLGSVNRYLPGELDVQLLEHGEHFERSPMYHALMLETLLDVRDAMRTVNSSLSERVAGDVRRMRDFLGRILGPDGQIPLLGDSVLGEAPTPSTLLEAPGQETESSGARRVGPYWIWREGGDQLLFDAGPVGADELPAHAHCDLLNVRMCVGGRPFVVDSGVFGYDDDELRRYCRSTAAHNVVQVDGMQQCDVWSRFRMGRRGRPSELETGETGRFFWARAEHDAYRHLGVTVRRWIGCREGGPWLVVDTISGSARRRVTSRLHFHPEVELQPLDLELPTLAASATGVRFRVGEERGTIRVLGNGEVAVKSGFYCPEFGRREESTVLEFEGRAEGELVCGWFVAFGEGPTEPELFLDEDWRLRTGIGE